MSAIKVLTPEIINKVLDRKGSEAEAVLVYEWFKTKEGQKYLSDRMDDEYLGQDLYSEDRCTFEFDSEALLRKINSQIRKKRIIYYSRYAAVLILPIILFTWTFLRLNSYVDLIGESEYAEVYVPKGKQMQIMFQDGSMAYLNSDTRIKYPKKFGLTERTISLTGEAYFMIEKNPNRPFVVEVDGANINVLGTSFNVEAYPSDSLLSLVLDEGLINFHPNESDRIYEMEPGEKLVYDKQDQSCAITRNRSLVNQSAWIDDEIYVDDKSLLEVISILDRRYDTRFVIEDNSVLKYRYTILITKNSSLTKVIRDLEKISPVRFERKNNTYFVSMGR